MIELYRQYLLDMCDKIFTHQNTSYGMNLKGFLNEYKNFGHDSLKDACEKAYWILPSWNTTPEKVLSYEEFIAEQRDIKLNQIL